ncbi:hypothetical protein C0992_002209 [Termitomyces sp. T32_za158]|nr:hypothetical protein C0992_002209 [Termitomyces sp. T32_za158]
MDGHFAHHGSPSDLDDPFSAADHDELASAFSPEAMRQDIARARHVPQIESAWTVDRSNGVLEGQNLSVSTLDIDGHEDHTSTSPSPSPPPTPHPLSPQLSDQFSQISLGNESEEPAAEQASPEVPNLENENTPVHVHREEQHERPTTSQSLYPEYALRSPQSTQSLPPPEASHPSPTPRPLSATPIVPSPSSAPSTSETHSRSNSTSSSASPPQCKDYH